MDQHIEQIRKQLAVRGMGACCSKCKGRKSRCYKRKRYAVNSNADDIKSPDQEAVTLRQGESKNKT